MKTLRLLIAAFLVAASASATDVQFTFRDCTAMTQPVRMLTFYPYYVNSLQPGGVTLPDRIVRNTGTNTTLTVSNLAAGTYVVWFSGTSQISSNWFTFPDTNVVISASATNADGTPKYMLDTKIFLGSTVPAFSQAESDLRYLKATNLSASISVSNITASGTFAGARLSLTNTTTHAWTLLGTNGHRIQVDQFGTTNRTDTNGLVAITQTNGSSAVFSNGSLTISGTVTATNYLGNATGLTNFPTAGRTFYVSTNGNNSTARINSTNFPWAGIWTNGVTSVATNPSDVIMVLPGRYTVSNGVPVTLSNGVTFQGVGYPVFHFDTNGGGTATDVRLTVGCFSLGDNCTLRGIHWEDTNVWNPSTSTGIFGAVGFGSRAFTNTLIEDVIFEGGSDVIYGGDSAFKQEYTLRKCVMNSYWDLITLSSAGRLFSDGNTYVGLGASNRISRFSMPAIAFVDIGSRFLQFSNSTANDYIFRDTQGALSFNGSVMDFATTNWAYFINAPNRANLSGTYIDVRQNKTATLNPIRESYITNGFITNVVYQMNTNTIYITDATSDSANVNGTYNLTAGGITNAPVTSGSTNVMASWTNAAHGAIRFTMNDPNNPGFMTPGNTAIGILGSGAGYADYADVVSAFSQLDIPQNPTKVAWGATGSTASYSFATNAIITNTVPVLFPSIFTGTFAGYSNSIVFAPSNTATVAPSSLGLFYQTNNYALPGSLGFWDGLCYLRTNSTWKRIGI